MGIDLKIQRECGRRGITRLCHFTPSRNMAHIIAGQIGILATSHLGNTERTVFNATDLKRLDGHKNHICCSIEYPNVWYFSHIRTSEQLFRDWVVLLIKPDYLWQAGTLFCPRNAAASSGRYVCEGFEGFQSLYQGKISGARNMTILRQETHLTACPTDNQAEVLIPDCIKLFDIVGVVVRDENQARNEICRLRLQGFKPEFVFYVAPALYESYTLSNAISIGRRPEERLFNDGGHHDQ